MTQASEQLRAAYAARAAAGLPPEQQSALDKEIGYLESQSTPLDQATHTTQLAGGGIIDPTSGQPVGDTSPLPVPGTPPSEAKSPEQQATDQGPATAAQIAAASGVDVVGGLDPSLRFALSFAPNDAVAAETLQRFGYPHVRSGISGMEFYNDANARWTSVNEVGLSMGDIAEGLGIAPTALLDMAGTLVGSKLGGTAGRIGGSALGTWAGETLRLTMGRKLGFNDMSDDEIATQAKEHAGVAAGFGVAMEGILGSVKRIAKPTGGYSLADLQRMQRDFAAADPDIARIEAATGQRIPLTLGERINDVKLLDQQASLENEINLHTELETNRRKSQGTLKTFFDRFNSPPVEVALAGEQVKEALNNTTRPQLAAQQARQATTEATVRAGVEALPALSEPTTMRNVRSMLERAQTARKLKVDTAWDAVRSKINERYESVPGKPDELRLVSDVKVPASNDLKETVAKLLAEAKANPFPQAASATKGMLPARLRSMIPSRDPVSGAFLKGQPLDLAHLNKALEYLRDMKRAAGTTPSEMRNVLRLEGSLIDARNQAISPRLRRQIEIAEERTRQYHATFSRGLLANVLDEAGALRPNETFRAIFRNNDGTAARELVSVLKGDPQAIQQFRNAMFALYRKEATKGGIPVRELHDKFINDHAEVLAEFFNTPGSFAKLSRFGEFSDLVANQNARVAQLQKAIAKSAPGKFGQRFGPEEFTSKFVTGALDSTEVRQLTRALAPYPEALEAWRGSVSNELWRRWSSSGQLNSKMIRAFKQQYGEKLSTLYSNNPTYGADLDTLANVAAMAERKGKSTSPEGSLYKMLVKWMRVATGAMTRESRAQTAAQATDVKIARNALYRIITEPDYLHEAIALRGHQLNDPRVHNLLGSLGALSVLEDEDTGLMPSHGEK